MSMQNNKRPTNSRTRKSIRSTLPESKHVNKLLEYFQKELVDMDRLVPRLKLNSHIVFQDWMYKRGGLSIWKEPWKERWFCLCEDNTLRIINNDGLQRYIIYLSMMLSEAVFTWNPDAGYGTIKLECIGRNWKFMIPDEERFKAWRTRLINASQCSTNQVTSIIKSGVLQKRGQLNKMWRTRYCQLNRNGIFVYSRCDASGNTKGKVRGHFSLYHSSTTMKIDGEDERDFSIHQPERIWNFRACSVKEANKWRCNIRHFVQVSVVQALKDEPSYRSSVMLEQKNLALLTVNSCIRREFDRSYTRINSQTPLRSLILKKEHALPRDKWLETSGLQVLKTISQERIGLEVLAQDNNFVHVHENQLRVGKHLSNISRRPIPKPAQEFAKTGEFIADSFKNAVALTVQSESNRPESYSTKKSKVSLGTRQSEILVLPDNPLPDLVDIKTGESTMMLMSYQSNQIDPRLLDMCGEFGNELTRLSDTEHDSDSDDHSTNNTLNRRSTGVEDWQYKDVLHNAFYRFAGVSPYSNTNLKMSKADLNILLRCLELQKYCDELYSQLETDSRGLFSIEDFMDVFLSTETCSQIAGTIEYKFLVVTLMTMKNVDPSYTKRITREEFFILLGSFFDNQDEADEIFKSYDTDDCGQLHVANLFYFLRDYCELEENGQEEQQEEDTKYDEIKVPSNLSLLAVDF